MYYISFEISYYDFFLISVMQLSVAIYWVHMEVRTVISLKLGTLRALPTS